MKHIKKCRECSVVLVKGSSTTTPKGNCYPSNMELYKRICNSCNKDYYRKKEKEKDKAPFIKRRSSTIPFGYEVTDQIESYLKPVPNELKVLYVGQEWFKMGASYSEVETFIKENSNKTLSRAGLHKNFTKGNFVSNFYDVDINKLKRNCKICDRIYFISPIGSKVGGTGQRKYCTYNCKRTNRARLSRLRYLYTQLNKNPTKGFVYCITNPSFDGWVKIGKAINTKRRLSGLNVATPYRNFQLEYKRKFENYSRAEYFLLCKLNKASEKQSSEWFKINFKKAIKIIKKHKDVDVTEKNISSFISHKTTLISNLQRVTYI
mgnify:CR=1 FL=1